MSPAFDGSIHEIFSTLSYGATLVLEHGTNPLDHLKSATTAILTPSLAAMLHPSDYPDLETVSRLSVYLRRYTNYTPRFIL